MREGVRRLWMLGRKVSKVEFIQPCIGFIPRQIFF